MLEIYLHETAILICKPTNTNFVLLGQKVVKRLLCSSHIPPKDLKNQVWLLPHGRNNVHDHAYSFSPAKEPGLQLLGTDLTPSTTTTAVSLSTVDSAWSYLRGHWLPVQSLEWQGYNQLNIDHGLCPCTGGKRGQEREQLALSASRL